MMEETVSPFIKCGRVDMMEDVGICIYVRLHSM